MYVDTKEKNGKKIKFSTIFAAVFVRAVLILHNCLAIWRVVISREEAAFWGLAAGNILIVAEGVLVIRYNGGTEWKWWCPCFMSYLLTILPSIWLLQLSQYENAVADNAASFGNQASGFGRLVGSIINQTTTAVLSYNDTNVTTTSSTALSTTVGINSTTDSNVLIQDLFSLQEDTWIVVIQESLVYLLVGCRWVLPRGEVSREALSDLLLEYLAMASDIMELYAIFDEDVVKTNLGFTYAILSLWSISFIQFIPVLVHKHKYRHLQNRRLKRIERACGEFFAEVVVTLTSMCLQDGPFLCLRLYIMLQLNLVTYSLVFFVLKNIVTLMLLFYRLMSLCIRLPCCYYDEKEMVDIETIDFSRPVTLNTQFSTLPPKMRTTDANSDFHPYQNGFRTF